MVLTPMATEWCQDFHKVISHFHFITLAACSLSRVHLSPQLVLPRLHLSTLFSFPVAFVLFLCYTNNVCDEISRHLYHYDSVQLLAAQSVLVSLQQECFFHYNATKNCHST